MPHPPDSTTPPGSRPTVATADGLPGATGRFWSRYGRILTGLGLAYLVIAALGKLAYALPHLLRDVEEWSAIDLKYHFGEVGAWFAGQPVYGVVDGAVYPPASHAILWPFMGWLGLGGARVASLVKPTLALPIVVAALIASGRLRSATYAGGAYAVLTLAGPRHADGPPMTDR